MRRTLLFVWLPSVLALLGGLSLFWYFEYHGRTEVELDGARISLRLPEGWERAPDKEKQRMICFSKNGGQKTLWITCLEDPESSPEEMRDSIAMSLLLEQSDVDTRFVDVGALPELALRGSRENASFVYRIERLKPSKTQPGESWHWHMIVRFGSHLYKIAGHMNAERADSSSNWTQRIVDEFGDIFRSFKIQF